MDYYESSVKLLPRVAFNYGQKRQVPTIVMDMSAVTTFGGRNLSFDCLKQHPEQGINQSQIYLKHALLRVAGKLAIKSHWLSHYLTYSKIWYKLK